MQELEPSPVEDTPAGTEKVEYFPAQDAAPSRPQLTSSSSSLGLSGHNISWWCTSPMLRSWLSSTDPPLLVIRIQRYSSYTFTLFLTAHITNTSLLPLASQSLRASEKYLLLTRPYYQSSLLEPLIIVAPLTLHVVSGLALRLHRRRVTAKHYGAETRSDRRKVAWPKVSGTSALGFMLTPLLFGHAFVNRILPLWVDGGSSGVGLEYVAHGFAKHPALAFSGYAVYVTVASWHVVWGWAKWLGLTPDLMGWVSDEQGRELRKRWRWWACNGISMLIAAVWMAGGLGVVGRGGKATGWIGKGYDELYRRIPLVGAWM